MKNLIFIVSLLLIANTLSAQSILPGYDSLPVVKSKALKLVYEINNAGLKTIEIVAGKPEAVTLIPKKLTNDFAKGAITLFTGMSTSSSVEGSWVLPSALKINPAQYSWDIPLFVEGEYVKTRERVATEDGTSIEKQKGVVVNWQKGAYGLIREGMDTLGVFHLSVEVYRDSAARHWLYLLQDYSKQIADRLHGYASYPPGTSNYAYGVFRNKRFLIVTDTHSYRSLVVLNNEAVGMFQQNPPFIIMAKKDRIRPYLLYSKGADADVILDLARLSMLGILFDKRLTTEFYPDNNLTN